MSKKFWLTVLVSFVLLYAFQFILHALILAGFYASRPDGLLPAAKMQARMIWMPIGFLIWAYLWTYFFHRFALNAVAKAIGGMNVSIGPV